MGCISRHVGGRETQAALSLEVKSIENPWKAEHRSPHETSRVCKSSIYCLRELCAQHYSNIMGKYRRFKRLGAHFRSDMQLGSPCTSQLESNESKFLSWQLRRGFREAPGASVMSERRWPSSLKVKRQHPPTALWILLSSVALSL